MASSSQALSDEIESLLAEYLSLLNTYTTLRAELTTAQSSIYQNLARANFHAERGVRYGQDCYDERAMQPGCTCRVAAEEGGTRQGLALEMVTALHVGVATDASEADDDDDDDDGELKGEERQKGGRERVSDPIRMFGFTVPNALRVTQVEARRMVELVPQILNVDAKMKEVEIDIRRAKKRRGKLEGESKKISVEAGLGGREGAVVE
ncbi:uncharacterized protein L3040_006736 [Drepanopeziza brunnea f. sp. 'multigermtubi']|uniref:Vacuolar ATPase assembly protein VMA22 n=1 Tax=Marssonina brunnea f. sp. multigermtubi (strain MB_m1) TaxID=1072389 RepID=K1XXT9_MARBU|nr:uncharacterized protein MBM_04475 [Drepanopeziza brunnea f. sp. 'multigermtubi' MB_m1]EKD17614.1 hypothetical protein MBM_04475 [Drepanopeziza brunnea f. sp. 'multigermtubi' MB_m1]KAJ5039066.1 hypothetical protein L3040_006736 [Drepanopeziza brunnea f. sp. 'multigermtubi']